VVLFQAAITLLWARRAAAMSREVAAAREEAAIAKNAAATALASDRLLREGDAAQATEERRRAAVTVTPSGDDEPRDIYSPPGTVAAVPSAPSSAGDWGDSSAVIALGTVTEPEPPGGARGFGPSPQTPLPAAPMVAAAAADDAIRDPQAMAAAAWARMDSAADQPADSDNGARSFDDALVPADEVSPWLIEVAASEPATGGVGADVGPADAAAIATAAWIGTPDAAAQPAGNGSADSPAEDAPATSLHETGSDVLLVEDDENVVKLYRILLESRGYSVRHAPDGAIGIDEARRKRPDLILLDVMMPRMNGIMFLQSMREMVEIRDVPVVVLSNFKEPRLVERALSLGAIEYMVKAQTRPEALANAIPRWMRGEKVFPS
jgi:CheY-like chemotaxis protein